MTDRFSKEVQGVALYLEFRKIGSTCQVLITPDALMETGEMSFGQFFRRTISGGASKRKWQSYTLKPKHALRGHLVHSHSISEQEINDDVVGRVSNLVDYINSVTARGYKLVKDTPIYVEVTKADMTSIRKGDLPAKLWTRVKSSRSALDFPTEVVDIMAPSTVPSPSAF
jgi:hypothetical protein